MTVSGSKIDMNSNIIRERTFNGDSWGYTNTLSSVVTITVDGCQISNCGSTVLFTEKGLEPDVNFQMQDINSNTDGSIGDNAIVANVVNKYKKQKRIWQARSCCYSEPVGKSHLRVQW